MKDKEEEEENKPHKAAHKISQLNLFLYFLISGAFDLNELLSSIEGETLTSICEDLLLSLLNCIGEVIIDVVLCELFPTACRYSCDCV